MFYDFSGKDDEKEKRRREFYESIGKPVPVSVKKEPKFGETDSETSRNSRPSSRQSSISANSIKEDEKPKSSEKPKIDDEEVDTKSR